MKLYVSPFAPNAMRVQIFALEKRVAVDIIDVTQLAPGEYAKVNPLGQVPALETDDGVIVTESLTICQYLDEVSAPPRLFGATPEDRARIGMWERRAEMLLFIPSVEYGHHTHPMFAKWLVQYPDWAHTLVPKAERMLGLLAAQLGRHSYVAGDEVSVADFTAALGYFALVAWGALPQSSDQSVQDWSARMLARPSMAPLRVAMDAFRTELAAASGTEASR
ncbi:MAG TPA: glutathione S-transferase family protein [Sphingomicrobium sp.]